MKIVVDTNIIISGTFFGGYPARVLEYILDDKCQAFVSDEIIDEYRYIAEKFVLTNQGLFGKTYLNKLLEKMILIQPTSRVEICRDPKDDKFIECAIDAKALYIVSGDQDLLVLKNVDDVKIVTAKEFCELLQGL